MECVTKPDNYEKTLAQLRINEGVNLYAEDQSELYPKLKTDIPFLLHPNKSKWEIVQKKYTDKQHQLPYKPL